MNQRFTPIIFLLAILGVAASLAIAINLRNQWMVKKEPLAQEVAIKGDASSITELTSETCTHAGGKWNDCLSPCRDSKGRSYTGDPEVQNCIDQCWARCVCEDDGECPNGNYCKQPSGYCRIDGPIAADDAAYAAYRDAFNLRVTSRDGLTSVQFYRPYVLDGRPIFFDQPFGFSGTTTVFENQFSWRVTDDTGLKVAGGKAYANSPDSGLPGPFQVWGFYDALPRSPTGTLLIYDNSPKDGSEVRLLEVPVTVWSDRYSGPSEVIVEFGNNKKDPEMLDCGKVFPVKRIVLAPARDAEVMVALHELLSGPSATEKVDGYFSSLPEGVNFPKVESLGGCDYRLDFDESLEQGVGGSCRVLAIRSQIEATVKANCSDKAHANAAKITISINGRTEDILQP